MCFLVVRWTERERETDRQRETERDRHTHTHTQRQTEKQPVMTMARQMFLVWLALQGTSAFVLEPLLVRAAYRPARVPVPLDVRARIEHSTGPSHQPADELCRLEQRSRRAWLHDSASLVAASAFFAGRAGAAPASDAILVTGASSGIGKAVAQELAGRGYEVVLGCRDNAKAKSVAQEIRGAYDGASVISPVSPLDLSDLTNVRGFADEIKSLDIKPLRSVAHAC